MVKFPNSNLHFCSTAYDKNGNRVVNLRTVKGFSIQMNGGSLGQTYSILSGIRTERDFENHVSASQMEVMEQELLSHIRAYGTQRQKQSLIHFSAKDFSGL